MCVRARLIFGCAFAHFFLFFLVRNKELLTNDETKTQYLRLEVFAEAAGRIQTTVTLGWCHFALRSGKLRKEGRVIQLL